MGKNPDMLKYMMYNEMRRRDSRGRYMGDDMRQQRMEYGRSNGNETMRNGNDTMRNGNDTMRNGNRNYRDDVGRDRPDYGLTDRMGGEGYYTWNGNPDWNPLETNVTDMRQYQNGMTMGGEHKQKQRIGFAQPEENECCLTREMAEKWVHSMEPSDKSGKPGGMWTFEDVKRIAEEHGIPTHGQEMIDFYAAMNMMYSDYCKVARDHKVASEDYFADLAMAFLYDPDGVEPSEKIFNYYMYLVEHKNGDF